MRVKTILPTVLMFGLSMLGLYTPPSYSDDADAAQPAAPPAAGAPVTVELDSGRRFTAEVDARTDQSRLWLRQDLESGFLLRPIDWARVVHVELDGDVFSGEQFHHAVGVVRQSFPHESGTDSTAPRIVLGPTEGRPSPGSAPQAGEGSPGRAPEVRSLAIEARLANWDGDVEVDGLLVHILPLDGRGVAVPVHGTLEVTLTAERVGVVQRAQPFARLGRWTKQVRIADFGPYGAEYRLPFQSVHPDFDDRWAALGAVNTRLSVPGRGVFEQTADDVRIRPYSAVRDRLEQTTGRRFFEMERIGRGPR